MERIKLKNFLWIRNEIFDNPNLRGSDIMVYATLMRFMNNETRECYPSITKIKKLSRLRIQTVYLCLDRLEKEKLICRKRGRGRVNQYTLLEPPITSPKTVTTTEQGKAKLLNGVKPEYRMGYTNYTYPNNTKYNNTNDITNNDEKSNPFHPNELFPESKPQPKASGKELLKAKINKQAESIYDIYPNKADRRNSVKSIAKLLKAGITADMLKQAIVNYSQVIEAKGIEKSYIIQSNNFFGQAGRWEEYKKLQNKYKREDEI